MSFEDDDSGPSLKELVTKNLESNGILGKIQAQLRASVFITLEDEMKEKNIPLANKKCRQLLSTPTGRLAISIVQDFLQCLSLEFTLAVFNPESNITSDENLIDRNSLFQKLGSNCKMKDENYPFLFQLLEQSQILRDENPNDTPNSQPVVKLSDNNIVSKEPISKNKDDNLSPVSNKSNQNDLKQESGQSKIINETVLNQKSETKENLENNKKDISEDKILDKLSTVNGFSDGSEHSESLGNSKLNKKSLSDANKDYEDEYSSLKDLPDENSDQNKNSEEKEEEESKSESIDNTEGDIVEDIEEDIPPDEDISSLESAGSNGTKDITGSQASSMVDYQESL